MWTLGEAERRIREYMQDPLCEITDTDHSIERMNDRNITLADMMHVLAHGHISEKPQKATRRGHYKYKMCSQTPNSDRRRICVVVIPSPRKPALKIITAMWED